MIFESIRPIVFDELRTRDTALGSPATSFIKAERTLITGEVASDVVVLLQWAANMKVGIAYLFISSPYGILFDDFLLRICVKVS
jgi:hypothetical protein